MMFLIFKYLILWSAIFSGFLIIFSALCKIKKRGETKKKGKKRDKK